MANQAGTALKLIGRSDANRRLIAARTWYS
jgi:hypothetical protein